MKQFGKKLRELRKQHGWSQRELAHFFGVSHQIVSCWEKGENEMGIGRLRALCSLFDVSPSYLLGIETDEEKQAKEKAVFVLQEAKEQIEKTMCELLQ